ncbi:unnamed protein product [Ceratitis capitata]|uniref:(Mediterranean fruit fly) hypothetical protein n=1 Tax=Ceratitis capitata TaxID=7213 RepID=A0A811UPX6_CERCA|nr:unnamed protein product [Ceratitis capitata]
MTTYVCVLIVYMHTGVYVTGHISMYRWSRIENWIFNWFAKRKLICSTRGTKAKQKLYIKTYGAKRPTDIRLQLRAAYVAYFSATPCIHTYMYECFCVWLAVK